MGPLHPHGPTVGALLAAPASPVAVLPGWALGSVGEELHERRDWGAGEALVIEEQVEETLRPPRRKTAEETVDELLLQEWQPF